MCFPSPFSPRSPWLENWTLQAVSSPPPLTSLKSPLPPVQSETKRRRTATPSLVSSLVARNVLSVNVSPPQVGVAVGSLRAIPFGGPLPHFPQRVPIAGALLVLLPPSLMLPHTYRPTAHLPLANKALTPWRCRWQSQPPVISPCGNLTPTPCGVSFPRPNGHSGSVRQRRGAGCCEWIVSKVQRQEGTASRELTLILSARREGRKVLPLRVLSV
mmetsp:Transcript_15624/g.31688  ORF Transcript_15624/g.31688 Transcript_15624/m.31688 type:complete len:215 (+) Transcript_15624:679-1323(+)